MLLLLLISISHVFSLDSLDFCELASKELYFLLALAGRYPNYPNQIPFIYSVPRKDVDLRGMLLTINVVIVVDIHLPRL